VLIWAAAFEWSDAAFEFRPKQARFGFNAFNASFQMAEPPFDPFEARRHFRVKDV
jgi:hypothetical protein